MKTHCKVAISVCVHNRKFLKHFLCLLLILLIVGIRSAWSDIYNFDIADAPLDTRLKASPANIMFVMDDSGSMDWEVMTEELDGLFTADGLQHEYVFDDPGDHLYKTGVYADILTGPSRRFWKSQWVGVNRMYYNPSVTYQPWQDHTGTPISDADMQTPKSHPYRSHTLDMSDTYLQVGGVEVYMNQRAKKSNFPEKGVCGEWLYVGSFPFRAGKNGSVSVIRHAGSTGSSTVADAVLFFHAATEMYRVVDDQDPFPAFSVPKGNWYESSFAPEWNGNAKYTADIDAEARFTPDLPMDGVYDVYVWWNCFDSRDDNALIVVDNGSAGGVTISNAHYYTTGSAGEGSVYLVNFEDSNSDGTLDSRQVYRFLDSDNNEAVDKGELFPASPLEIPEHVTQRSWQEDLQNFANWFTYYRKRWLTTVAAVSRVIPKLEGVQVGFRSLNANLVQPVLPVNVNGLDESSILLERLQTLYFDVDYASTPLRKGLELVGLYFHTTETTGSLEPELEESPIDLGPGGECQQNFAIIFTDGYWNGRAPLVSNEDGDNGAPYADKWPGMLADVAMYYYENDLAKDVADHVPTNFYDKATWQHMVTYAITFGVNGHLDPDDYDLYNIDPSKRKYPEWPSPTLDSKDKVDDVWHAAVNGRGKYYSASNPEELAAAFAETLGDIIARLGSGASVSVNGQELQAGTTIYQSVYNTEGWTGDVTAYPLNPDTGEVLRTSPKWSASDEIDAISWDKRIIATYDSNDGSGVPFRWDQLPAGLQLQLGAEPVLNYLRGDDSQEVKNGGPFRNRYLKKNGEILRDTNKLGDIVHSAPVYYEGNIYVGANDGMLHVLDASTGREKCAYVPTFVFDHLAELANPGYTHKYYVDLTPYAKNIGSTSLLVGGLGKGGKGYYCLDIGGMGSVSTEGQLAAKVKWEYPNSVASQPEIDDLGFTFSKAFIVKSNAGWIVIFGNGYKSATGSAVLYVLDAVTGSLLTRIDTASGPSNGMSTPTPVDINADGVLDYVYAGDLLGNLWKFDFTGDSSADWQCAFQAGASPQPLFRARDTAGDPQPITAMCDVMLHCKKKGYMVVFGTGRYLGDSDLADTRVQTLYGIWDYGDDEDDSEYVGEFKRGLTPQLSNQPSTVTLLEQTEIYYGRHHGHPIRIMSDNEADWITDEDPDGDQYLPNPSELDPNHAGWFFDLPITKERVVRDVIIRDGRAIVISSIPESSGENPCAGGGYSIVHEISACSGARLNEPAFDANDDNEIDDEDNIVIEDPDTGELIEIPPSGIGYDSMLYEPIILNNPPVEIKYFSSSSGNIVMLYEQPERTGYGAWREIY
jgi:type IV pilus assembly protein PilY1